MPVSVTDRYGRGGRDNHLRRKSLRLDIFFYIQHVEIHATCPRPELDLGLFKERRRDVRKSVAREPFAKHR